MTSSNHDTDRRDFPQKSVFGTAAAGLAIASAIRLIDSALLTIDRT